MSFIFIDIDEFVMSLLRSTWFFRTNVQDSINIKVLIIKFFRRFGYDEHF